MATLFLLVPAFAFGCACCTESGLYSLRTGKPSEYDVGLMKDIEFDHAANLYMTEAGFDMLKGLGDIEAESSGAFDLVNSFTGRQWKFEVRSPAGKRGTLTLPLPASMVTYKVDIHDEEDRPNGPNLYKEFRFKGAVAGGTGIFRSSMARPSTYFLIFQGRGNGCDNASDFTHWRLEINGPKAAYAFYGGLTTPADE